MKKIVLLLLIMFIVMGCDDAIDELSSYRIYFNLVNAEHGETLSANHSSASAGTVITLSAHFLEGRGVTLSAPGVTFSSSIIQDSDSSVTFTMPESNVTISAAFNDLTQYNVTVVESGKESEESLVLSHSTAYEGVIVSLSANLNPYRKVVLSSPDLDLSEFIMTEEEDMSFIMPSSDVTIYADYSYLPDYDIVTDVSGSISGESIILSSSSAHEGMTITLTANLASHRKITLSSTDAELSKSEILANGGSVTFTMPSSEVTISVEFSYLPSYDITAVLSGNNPTESLALSSSPAYEGMLITLTAHLDSYRKVTLNSSDVDFSLTEILSDGDSVTFIMPSSDISISAVFNDLVTSNISLVMTGNESGESISLSHSIAMEGEEVTLTANLNDNRRVSLSSSQGIIFPADLNADGAQAVFIMPSDDVLFQTEFSDIEIPEINTVVMDNQDGTKTHTIFLELESEDFILSSYYNKDEFITLPEVQEYTTWDARCKFDYQIIGISPGDSIVFQITFIDPLVLSQNVPPYLSFSFGGNSSGGVCTVESHDSSYNGTLSIDDTYAVLYGNNGTGILDGFSFGLRNDPSPMEGQKLDSIIASFIVEDSMNIGVSIPSNQTIGFKQFYINNQMDGDFRNEPWPFLFVENP